MKTCTRCKISKPVSEFGHHLRMADGLRSACKTCERKPPRVRNCAGCGEDFSFSVRGPDRHLCDECEKTLHWCYRCKSAKPRSEFHQQAKSRMGVTYSCKVCTLEYGASGVGFRSRKGNAVKSRYGITLEEYEAHLLAAEGVCPCCGKTGRKKMCMDHDHQTGRIRGIICSACNSGIGLLGDSIDGLRKAIEYLERVNP